MKGAHVVWVGPFGSAVVRHLSDFLPDLRVASGEAAPAPGVGDSQEFRCQLLAAWRPVPSLCDDLDRRCRERGIPFMPLIVDGADLRLGPVMLPEGGACWQCWELRSRQHAASARERSALLRHYTAHSEAGPRGYLEPFALMGASRLVAAMRGCEERSIEAGWIWQLNVFTGDVQTGRLIGLDSCRQCGLERPAESRTYAELRERLGHLWAE